MKESELTGLMWIEEMQGLDIFVLPGHRTKNSEERIVPLNSTAKAIIEAQRDKHDEYVFTFMGNPVLRTTAMHGVKPVYVRI